MPGLWGAVPHTSSGPHPRSRDGDLWCYGRNWGHYSEGPGGAQKTGSSPQRPGAAQASHLAAKNHVQAGIDAVARRLNVGLQVKVLLPDWQVAGQGSCLGAEDSVSRVSSLPRLTPLSRSLGFRPEPPLLPSLPPAPGAVALVPQRLWQKQRPSGPASMQPRPGQRAEWLRASVSPPRTKTQPSLSCPCPSSPSWAERHKARGHR